MASQGTNNQSTSSQMKKRGQKKTNQCRRIWTVREEQILIGCLKDINNPTWKAEAGTFRPGYITQLEKDMAIQLPGTDLKANPHIESKLKVWKKTYQMISTMMATSGFGWNAQDNMVTVDREDVWDEFVKREPDAKNLRNKSFPYFHDWGEIWGNDRATGEHAETVAEAVEELAREDNEVVGNANEFTDLDDLDDIDASVFVTQDTRGKKKKGAPEPRKRKRSADEMTNAFRSTIKESIAQLSEETGKKLDLVASRIGHEVDKTDARMKLRSAIALLNLSQEDELRATTKMGMEPKLIDCFLGLPESCRALWVKMLLEGTLQS